MLNFPRLVSLNIVLVQFGSGCSFRRKVWEGTAARSFGMLYDMGSIPQVEILHWVFDYEHIYLPHRVHTKHVLSSLPFTPPLSDLYGLTEWMYVAMKKEFLPKDSKFVIIVESWIW